MENNPYKVIYCVKNNNGNHQYYHYIFLGNIKYKLKNIIEKFKNLSLTDTIGLLTKEEINELENYYGIKWFKFFFNKEHIDYSFSTTNPKYILLANKLNLELINKKEYKPLFTYGFNTQKQYINSYLKNNKFANYQEGGDNEQNENEIMQIQDDIKLLENNLNDEEKTNKDEKENNKEEELNDEDNKVEMNMDLDDIIKDIKDNENVEVNQSEIDKLLNEKNEELEYEMNDDIVEETDEYIEDKLSKKEIKELENDMKQTEKIITFKELELDKSKDDNEYEENLYNSYNKYYVYDLYINKDDTIKNIKNKISIVIKNKSIYQTQNIIPSRMYLWIRWLIDEKKEKNKKQMDIDKYNALYFLVNSSNRKEEDICLGNLWLENNNILHYPIKPLPNINTYLNMTKEIQELNDKINKSTVRINRRNLENNILSSMNDYLENNDIFMIDIYNEIGNINNISNEQLNNLQNIFFKIYFPDINPNEIKQILAFINNAYKDNKNIDGEKEYDKIEQEYQENYIESSLSFKIENIYHDVYENNKINYTSTNYITQIQLEIKLISEDLLNFQRLELYKIFDNFKLNKKYVFIQYTQFNNDSIFKFDEETIDYLIREKDLYINILKWFNVSEYGLIFRINYNDNFIPLNIFIDVVGRMVIKFYWKEEDKITTEQIKDYYYVIKDLINDINEIIESKIEIPTDEQFKILFITSLEKFNLSGKKEINHNELSNFSRLFYPYFSLVIEPNKRKSENETKKDFSKYGTYLRYKRINDYENITKIENRIKYFIRYVDISNKDIINEIAKQFNLTNNKATEYYNNTINKYPNIKKNTKKLKNISEVGKDKMDGIDIGIQGKTIENYKIRLSGVRSIEQLNDINNIVNTLLFLYDEIYIKKTIAFKYLLDLLNKIKNIAERRNFVSEFVKYEPSSSDIKQMQSIDNIYVGYDTGKGIPKHSRICQNSGKDNRRRPLQFTDDNINNLLKDGYKLNNATGMYEKQTIYKGSKITLRVVKLKGNDNSNIYYTCTPEHNGKHTYIGFLTKGKNPFGKFPPCCFKTDAFISKNKDKQNFNFNQLKDINTSIQRERQLTYNELYYILADIIKVPNDRIALLPDILDFYLNINNNKSYKIIQHILTHTNSYYFKMGCGDETLTKGRKFCECVCKAINKNYDDFINELIIELNKNNNLFTYLNNGEIKFNFVKLENYINYLKSSNYSVHNIIHLIMIYEKVNIFVLEKNYVNSNFKWDIKFKYLNNEEKYNFDKSIFIIEQDYFYTLLINIIKDKKDIKVIKLFDKNNEIIDYMFNFFNDNFKYKNNCARDIYFKSNNNYFIGQQIDIKNKCNYLINKEGLLIPTINSGIVLNLKELDINNYIKSYNETIKLMKNNKLEIKYLIYDKIKNKKYRIRGIGIDKYLIIPIKKEYINNSSYQLINQPSYIKLDKLIQNNQTRKEIKKDDRIKIINAMKYKNEAYELFRYNLCYFFKDDTDYKERILNIINDENLVNETENKVDKIRKILYEIINNEKANKFYYNKTKDKIISKNKTLIYVYSKINLDDYELNNNRMVSELKNKLNCNCKHEFYDNGRCMFSLSINLLIEFINRLTYELLGNELKRYEVLRLKGYKVSSIVNEEYFTNRNNEKMLKKKSNDSKNPFIDYYQSQNKFIPYTKKIYKEKKRKIDNVLKEFKQNGRNNQPVFDNNKYLRAIANAIYYYQNKINLGYYNELQDKIINKIIGNIIDLMQEKQNDNMNNDLIYDFVIKLTSNSDLIDYKILYEFVSQIYQLNIEVIDNNEKVLYSSGKSAQLIILDNNGIICHSYI